MSQREVLRQAPALAGLVVKHGFIDEPAPEQPPAGSWRRIASDPVLWSKGLREDEEDEQEACAASAAGRDGEATSAGSDRELETGSVSSLKSSSGHASEEAALGCSGSGSSTPQRPSDLPFEGQQPQQHADPAYMMQAMWCSQPVPELSCQMSHGVLLIPCGYVAPEASWCSMSTNMDGMSQELYQWGGAQQTRHRNPAAQGDVPWHVQRRLRGQRSMFDDDNVTDVRLEERTTVMLRNLPNNYSRDMLVEMLNSEGFAEQFDFLYLPVDFRTHASLGYAFINLVTPDVVPRFWEVFNGYSNWSLPSRKECFVSWCGPHQGYHAHVERYRSSPVMHPMVPDEYKPAVFKHGVRVEFPPPIKKPRVPRVRSYVRNNA